MASCGNPDIDVENSDYHQLSQCEIGGAKRLIWRHSQTSRYSAPVPLQPHVRSSVPLRPASAEIDLRPSSTPAALAIARPRAENTSVSAKLRLMVHSAVRGTIGMPAAAISGGAHASIYALSNRRCSSAALRGRTHTRLSPVGSHLGS